MLRRLRCHWIGCVVARLQAGQGLLVCGRRCAAFRIGCAPLETGSSLQLSFASETAG